MAELLQITLDILNALTHNPVFIPKLAKEN